MADEFQLTAEEIAEEAEDAAARVIQRAVRGRRALVLLKRLIRANYVKIRDPEIENGFLYKNKTTGEVREDKPAFLGADDLPDPREFKAPFGYDPAPIEDFGAAMVVTVVEYQDARITNLESGFHGEHIRFENLLTHDFKCRFMEESVVSLLNPTVSEFVDGLERLQHMAHPAGFTFIYICTHAATVSGHRSGYLCFKDTNWMNTETAKQTALPFSRLCSLINGVPGNRKTVALSIAHPSKSQKRFSSALKLYPPKNFYGDLADNCKCAVLGSCNIGTNVREILMHTSPLPVRVKESRVMRALRRSQKKPAKETKVELVDDLDSSSSEESGSEEEDESEESRRTVGPVGPVRYRRYKHHELCPAVVQQYLALRKKRKRDRIKRDSVEIKEPHPAWQRHAEHGFVVITPQPKEHRKYYWAKKWERFVKVWRPQLDKWSESTLQGSWLKKDTPRQLSFADQGGSAFLQAVSKALDGGIDYSSEVTDEMKNASLGVVKVCEVFKHVRTSMKRYFDDLNTLQRLEVQQQLSYASINVAATEKDDRRDEIKRKENELLDQDFVAKQSEELGDQSKIEKKKKKKKKEETRREVTIYRALPPQDPVLFVPVGSELSEAALSYPVCFRPSAPPPSDKPFAIKVGATFVLLEWEQADFDGAIVSRYDVYMRNDTRLYSDWKLAPNSSNIPSGGLYTRFTVNHLPIGIRTEFRVVGYNSVGRSLPSKASVKITPGEKLVPVGSEHRWRRLAHGGVMSVLDHMERYLIYRNEILRGFRLLVAFAQKTQGFLRLSTQVRASTVSVAVLKQYPHDSPCISGALLLIGYSYLGASQSSDARVYSAISSLIEESNISLLVSKYMLEFAAIHHFRQAVYWCLASGAPLRNVDITEKAARHSAGGAKYDDLFNIFTLKSEEGDENIVDNNAAAEDNKWGSDVDGAVSGSNRTKL